MFPQLFVALAYLLAPANAQLLADSVVQTAKPVSVPENLSPDGLNSIFGASSRLLKLTKGSTQTVFLRWFTYDGLGATTGYKSYTAAYQIKVDDYSQITVPNCTNALI
jgi:hypothetical protein